MSKITSQQNTIRALSERIDAAWAAGQFGEVENLCTLMIETVEMIRVHARVARKYPQPVQRVPATLTSNVAGSLWTLSSGSQSMMFFTRENAESEALRIGWDIVEVTTYSAAG